MHACRQTLCCPSLPAPVPAPLQGRPTPLNRHSLPVPLAHRPLAPAMAPHPLRTSNLLPCLAPPTDLRPPAPLSSTILLSCHLQPLLPLFLAHHTKHFQTPTPVPTLNCPCQPPLFFLYPKAAIQLKGDLCRRSDLHQMRGVCLQVQEAAKIRTVDSTSALFLWPKKPGHHVLHGVAQ